MKKQMSMDTTDLMISDVEKNHECVIEKGFPRLVAVVNTGLLVNTGPQSLAHAVVVTLPLWQN